VLDVEAHYAGNVQQLRQPSLAIVLSFHWFAEHIQYTSLRDRLGLCLPSLLQIIDLCSDALVRFVGISAVHIILDHAIAVEVQNLVPPLEHCFATTAPLFLQGELTSVSAVAPYCAGIVQFVLKGFVQCSPRQQVLDRLLTFGYLHCRTSTSAFQSFLEFGVLPLLARDVLLLASRLRQVMEMLLQSTESTNVKEVLLGWHALCILLQSELQSRMKRYLPDILLRMAFTYLTFLGSELQEDPSADPIKEDMPICSPVAKAMTPQEQSRGARFRRELEHVLEKGVELLEVATGGLLDSYMSEIEAQLQDLGTKSSPNEVQCGGKKAPNVNPPWLQDFCRFVRRGTLDLQGHQVKANTA